MLIRYKKTVLLCFTVLMFGVGCAQKPKENITKEEKAEMAVEEAIEAATGEGVVNYTIGLSDKELTDEYKSEIETLNTAIDDYFQKNKAADGIVSLYGNMNRLSDDSEITVDLICNTANISIANDVKAETEIILVKPQDIDPSYEGKGLAPFSAYNTKEGYYVSSSQYGAKTMSFQDYRQMRMNYSFDHGQINVPKKGDKTYQDIIKAVAFPEPYDVKHISNDDKYAVLVIGSKEKTEDVREFLLEYRDEKWQVLMKELEKRGNAKQEVNFAYPDVELGLLPKYNIASYSKRFTPELKEKCLKELADSTAVTAEDKSGDIYVCDADAFMFIEYEKTGKIFVAHYSEEEELFVQPCSDLETAIKYMLKLNNDPPVFICLFGK
ncbi:MAG: hypothetical protein IJS61_06755 [Firmicutes bacterium]|nr:hypothetical protein [Bacillota bacterium]